MPKLTRQDVMQKYTVRVYDKDQADLLNRAMEKFMPMIGNKTDTIRHFALIGADKMLGDSQINNSINFSEIRRYMQGVDEKLDKIEKGQKSYFAENTGEVLTNQAMTNLNTKLLLKSTGINLRSYGSDWKYEPTDYDLEILRANYKKDLLNGRR